MSFPYALELVDVVKRFGDHTAVDNVSFTVETGTIMALLGPNGAGKTTTIEMCEGFQRPDSGKISVLGMSPVTEPDKVRAQVGIMLQDSGSYSGIRVREMLELTASYSRDPLKPEWLLELFGLQNVQRTTYRRLSGGQKQRLNLAVALISRPRLVFVDEPTAGMDAQSRLLVWDLLRALRSDGVTVILTTHLMDEAQALADRVTIVDRGRVVAQAPRRSCRRPPPPRSISKPMGMWTCPGASGKSWGCRPRNPAPTCCTPHPGRRSSQSWRSRPQRMGCSSRTLTRMPAAWKMRFWTLPAVL